MLPHNTSDELLSTSFSNDFQQIISHRPGWIIRNGIVWLLGIFMGVLVTCWFVRYPDIVASTARLTSINAPKPVVSVNGGKLVSLLVKEGDAVNAGQALGFIESTASHRYILQLEASVDAAEKLLALNQVSKLQDVFHYETVNAERTGELQPAFQTLFQAWLVFQNYLEAGFYIKKRKLLNVDMNNIKRLAVILDSQKNLLTRDLKLAEQTFTANEQLKQEKVISELDYRVEMSKLINKQMSLPQLNSSIIANENQQNEKQKEIMELDNSILQQKNIFSQALETFRSQLMQWKRNYILQASVTGKVSFATFFTRKFAA